MTTTPTSTAGANVRAEMARRGVRQAEAAQHLGVSQAALSKRLRGATPFDINELVALAQMLSCSIEVLIEGVVPAEVAAS